MGYTAPRNKNGKLKMGYKPHELYGKKADKNVKKQQKHVMAGAGVAVGGVTTRVVADTKAHKKNPVIADFRPGYKKFLGRSKVGKAGMVAGVGGLGYEAVHAFKRDQAWNKSKAGKAGIAAHKRRSSHQGRKKK